MKEYQTENIRNIALLGHDGSGKTSLLEGLLYSAGAISRLGKVQDGTAIGDFEPEEVQRKVTIQTTLAACEKDGYKYNFLDAPGYGDFVGEVASALRAADSSLVVVCATSGVQVETENSWRYVEKEKLPCGFFINKMDRENADFFKSLTQLREFFGGTKVFPLQLPIGVEQSYCGTIDLVSKKAYKSGDETGMKWEEISIPENMEELVEEWRSALMEYAAEQEEEWTNKYLEGEELTVEEFREGIRRSIAERGLFPVFCGAMLKNIGGIQMMADFKYYFPKPTENRSIGIDGAGNEVVRKFSDPFSAFVFKTTADPFVGRLSFIKVLSGVLKSDMPLYNVNKEKMEKIGDLFSMRGKAQESLKTLYAGDVGVISKLQDTSTGDTLAAKEAPITYLPLNYVKPMLLKSLEAKKKGDEDKIGQALLRISEEDPTLHIEKDRDSGEILIRGIGEQQLDVMTEKIKRKFGVEIILKSPKVPYRETIRGAAQVEGRHKKQTGGHGQFGHVWLKMEPLPEGTGIEFVDSVVGGAVPRQYIPAVDKGLQECIKKGPLANCQVVDMKVTLYDGSSHSVDSSELAFKMATFQAFRKGMLEAKPVLLEPIYEIEVNIPESYMGDVVGDLNSRRGRILGMESMEDEKGRSIVRALVPLAELAVYPTELRSLTQGRGRYDRKFDHYEEVPAKIAEPIIEATRNAQAD